MEARMAYYVLLYETAPGYVERRKPWRPEHLALAEEAHRDGALVLAGAFDPADGALLVFRGDSPDVAERFARSDPYVRNGLVTRWTVKRWSVVIGGDVPSR